MVAGEEITLLSTASIQTIFGSLPTQQSFIVSSIFSSGLAEFDQNVIFMPMEDSIPFFGALEDDIFLEIFLKKPEKVLEAKLKVQNLFSEFSTGRIFYGTQNILVKTIILPKN